MDFSDKTTLKYKWKYQALPLHSILTEAILVTDKYIFYRAISAMNEIQSICISITSYA